MVSTSVAAMAFFDAVSLLKTAGSTPSTTIELEMTKPAEAVTLPHCDALPLLGPFVYPPLYSTSGAHVAPRYFGNMNG
jgi:hypothetical protein